MSLQMLKSREEFCEELSLKHPLMDRTLQVFCMLILNGSHFGLGFTEGYKVEPMLIADIYRDLIIPLTKDVEVRYLFLRVGVDPPAPDLYYHLCRGPLDAFDDPDSTKLLIAPSIH